jgi:small subunit ribosomal protein S11e
VCGASDVPPACASQVERYGGRFIRNVGLGFKTPREAIEGTYIDKKCPFTGNVSIRGRILTGTVQSLKMQVRVEMWQRYIRRLVIR